MNDYLLLALIELGALAVLVSITIATFLFLRRRKLHAVVQAAAKKLRKSEDDRQRTLTAILSGVHRLPESVSAGLSTQLMQCERSLLRQCFDILLSPDPASAAKLSDIVLAGLDDYLRKCAAPNMPRTETPAPESAGSVRTATPKEGEKLPFWMNKLEKGEPLKDGEAPPELQTNPEAFWPARTGWIEEPREKQETALPEDVSPAEEEEIGAPPVDALAETPEEAESALTPDETVPASGTADFTDEIGGLLDTYEMEHAPAAAVGVDTAEPEPPLETAGEPSVDNAVEVMEPSLVEPPPPQDGTEAVSEPPGLPAALPLKEVEAGEATVELDSTILSPPAVTVADLMAEFGLAPPLPSGPVNAPAQEPATAPPETGASATAALAGDVDALLAELSFHAETPPAVPEQKPIAAPLKKPVSSYVEGSVAPKAEAPQANASAVDALLAEFGFHDEAEMKSPKPAQAKTAVREPARESPDTAHADPAAVEALLAEFGFVPDLGEGAESDTASPAPAPRGTGKRKIVDETQENSETTANKRRGGRKKAENP